MPEKTARPKIEEVIVDVLEGDIQKNASDFIAYLKTNEMAFEWVGNMWKASYKDERVCHIWLDGAAQAPGPWTIWPDGDYSSDKNFPVDEHTKEIAWENIKYCEDYPAHCNHKKSKEVFGKNFDDICGVSLAFTNPDAEALACAKKMIEIRKSHILNSN